MSIADKLLAIAENVPKVYEAGQKSVVDESKIIEKSESGVGTLVLDDVSEFPHDVEVVLSSDTLEDLSGVSLFHIGKNLFDYSVLSNAGFTTINNPETGEFTFNNVSGIIGTPIVAKPNTAYRISGYVKGTIDGHNIFCSPNYTDGSNENISTKAIVGEYVYFEGLTRSDKTLASIKFGGSGGIKVGTVFKNVQVELSTDATPYEPFKKDYYPSSADGAVPRIKSLSPAMTFKTDDGVKITANYHQSYGVYAAYHHFWDEFQRLGNKTDYRYAFYNWPENIYDPKYPIVVTGNASQTFYYFQGTDTKVDITLNNISAQFFASSKLKIIRKLILGEKATSYNNMFQLCSALETINFDGIVVANMDLSPCPLLTHDSIMSLFNVLKDYAGSGSTYTVTLGATNLAKLTDAEKAIATGKGWTLA